MDDPNDHQITYDDEKGQNVCTCGAAALPIETVDFGTTYYRCADTSLPIGGSGL